MPFKLHSNALIPVYTITVDWLNFDQLILFYPQTGDYVYMLRAKGKEKPLKDRQIADLERQLQVTSVNHQVNSSPVLALLLVTMML